MLRSTGLGVRWWNCHRAVVRLVLVLIVQWLVGMSGAHAMSAACSTLNGLGATTSYTQRFQASAFQAGESVSVSFSDNGAGIGGSPTTADVAILGQYSTVAQYRYSSDTGTAGSHVGTVDSSFLTTNGLYVRIKATSYLSPVVVSCSSAAVSNDATLSALSLSAGTLAPGFASGTTSYNASVGNSVSSIAVTPTAASASASLTVNGMAATSGATTTIALAVGTNVVNVTVTAQDGSSTQTYQINVLRASPPPTAGAVSVSVAANSADSPVPLLITGGAATAVAIVSPPAHGTATTSGTAITYRPNTGYVGTDTLTYTASNESGTSAPAVISVTVNAPALAYAPGSPSGASVGVAYSQSVASAGGGTAPYSYALASGALPPGIALTSTGTLSGTPTGAGNYAFSVTATDSSTGSGPVSTTSGGLTFAVAAPTLALSPASATFNVVPGQSFSQTFGATGGTAPYRYALNVQSGAMPAGMIFNTATGSLSGTPTGAGSVTFSVAATDSSTGAGSPFSVLSTYTLTVAAPTVTIGPAPPPNATAGLAYSQMLTASGGASPYQFVITAGALPAGLALSAAGALTGVPRASGAFALTIMATDNNGYTGSRAINLIVAAPTIGLAPATVPGAAVGSPYSQAFTATDGNAPYTFSVVAGALPSGLTLGSGGLLAGTPTVGGTYNFSVQVQDSTTGGTFTATRPYTMTVGAATLTVSPPALAVGTVGVAYTQSLSTAGGTPGYTYAVTAGALPPGITLSAAGLLSGRPTAGGAFSFTVISTDSSGGSGPFSGLQAYTMTVAAPTLAVAPLTLPTPTVGMPYSQTLTASGGMAPYTFSVMGTLPAGLTLSSSGLLSGTPTAGGSYNFTVRATDSSSGAGPYSANQSYAMTMGAPTLALNPTSLPAPTVGTAYSQTVAASGGVAPYTYAVSAGALPAGLTLDAATGAIRGTPTASGASTFAIRATDSSTGAGAPYSVTRAFTLGTLQSVPTAPPVVVGTRANAPVTIHAAASAANGPFIGVAIVMPPASGSVAVQGVDIVYTPVLTSSGAITFTYALQNAVGQSAPITVTVNVDAVPVPVASAQASVSSGKGATLNVTENASGGPFTGVNVVSVVPANAGEATVSQRAALKPMLSASQVGPGTSGSDFIITFAPAAAFAGTAVVTYTISNAVATSAPAILTITVAERRDPSTDPDVSALINAQIQAARRFATAQISNYNQRLEQLHSPGRPAFRNTMNVALPRMEGADPRTCQSVEGLVARDDCMRGTSVSRGADGARMALPEGTAQTVAPRLVAAEGGPRDVPAAVRQASNGTAGPRATTSAPSLPDLPGEAATVGSGGIDDPRLAFWTAGTVDFGFANVGAQRSGFRFSTGGVTAGADYRLSDQLTLGVGLGYGRDATDIGSYGTHSSADAFSAAVYGSYRPAPSYFVDGVAGYGALRFDSRRWVTDEAGFATGKRDGHQWFASLTSGYEYRDTRWLISPYGRMLAAQSTLDPYSEAGAGIGALTYFGQTVNSVSGTAGLRGEYAQLTRWGTFLPFARVEYQHDFEGQSAANLAYVDLVDSGRFYTVNGTPFGRDRVQVWLGAKLRTRMVTFGMDYNVMFGMGGLQQGVRLTLAAPF